MPGLYPPDMTSAMGSDPNPALTSAGILSRLQSDGTWDQLSPTEQADWMFRLAGLQRDEINQRFTQASLQQNAENTMLNLRRAPIELAFTAQDRSRNWRDSMSLYAATLQNLVNSACNTTTGGVPGVTPGAAINGTTGVGGALGFGATTINPIINGFRRSRRASRRASTRRSVSVSACASAARATTYPAAKRRRSVKLRRRFMLRRATGQSRGVGPRSITSPDPRSSGRQRSPGRLRANSQWVDWGRFSGCF
jgi:hypothetical protein